MSFCTRQQGRKYSHPLLKNRDGPGLPAMKLHVITPSRYDFVDLRGTVFFVMLMWAVDKSVRPGHAESIIYGIFDALRTVRSAS